MQREKESSKLFDPKSLGILSLSLLTMATGIVSPAIPAIAKQYPAVSQSLVDQVSTIPSFLMALFILISGWIVRKIGTKKTVIIGLWLIIASTVLSLIAPNIYVLLAARALLGAGIGMYNSLAVSLITVSYQGDKQSQLLGWQNAFQGIGALGGSLLVSVLLLIHWRASFIIYFIAIYILFVYQKNVPEIAVTGTAAEDNASAPQKTNWMTVIAAGIVTFVLMAAYMISVVKIPTYLIQNNIGSASTSSLLIGAISLLIIFAGIIYGNLYKRLGYGVLIIASFLMLAAYALLAFSHTLITSALATILIGVAFGFFVPFTFGAASNAADISQSDNVTKFMMIMNNLANFAAPFLAASISGNSSSTNAVFSGGTIVLTVAFILILLVGVKELAHIRNHSLSR